MRQWPPRSSASTPSFVIAATALIVVASLAPASPAGGQVPRDTLRLASQTMWWQGEEPFRLSVLVTTTRGPELEVAVDVLNRVTTRTAFAATDAGARRGGTLQSVPPTQAGADGPITIAFTPTLPRPGVYPILVRLREARSGDVSASFVTYLLHFPKAADGERLRVAMALPFHAPPSVEPDGTVAVDDSAARQLSQLAAILAQHREPALTIVPTPETVEALATGGGTVGKETVAALAASMAGRDVMFRPWVSAAGVADEDRRELTARGAEVLQRWFATASPSSAALADDGVAFQDGNGPLVVPERLLRPLRQRLTLAHTFDLDVGGRTRPAAALDPALSSYFRGSDEVLDAQRLLADLAVLYDDDRADPGRGQVVAPENGIELKPAFVATVLDGLRQSPVLTPVGLDAFFSSVTPATGTNGAALQRELSGEATSRAPSDVAASLRMARDRLDAYVGAIDVSDPEGAAARDRLERTCLVSLSSDLSATDRGRYLRGIMKQVAAELSAVDVPSARSITLTAREGSVPVTVVSRLRYPLRAVLVVTAQALDVPDGNRRGVVVAPTRNTTSGVIVRAPTSGAFPAQVILETPAGLIIDRSKVTVRSTAVTGAGSILSLGALAFLAIWWGRHVSRRRSGRLIPR